MTSSDPVERSWDLSLYELHRTPQEAITDDTEIAVSAHSLKSELTCPICLDMLTQTMTTKECLHRYSTSVGRRKEQELGEDPVTKWGVNGVLPARDTPLRLPRHLLQQS
jgi:hypothetical protein